MPQGTYGHESRFSIIVGKVLSQHGQSRRVDVYAADRWLTCADNNVQSPFFAGRLQDAIRRLLADPKSSRGRPFPELSVEDNYRRLRAENEHDGFLSYRFMDWGPTADNVVMLLFREVGTAYLPFSLCWPDGQDPSELGLVFVAELPEWELASVMHDAAWAIMWDWADRSKWPK